MEQQSRWSVEPPVTPTTNTASSGTITSGVVTGNMTESGTAHEFSQLVRNSEYEAIVRALATAESTETIVNLLTGYDEEGHTALHWAAFLPRVELVEALLAYVGRGNNVCVDLGSKAEPQLGQTPLHWAVISGRVENVRAFLEAGAEPDVADAKGYDAAVHAAQYGHVDVLHVLLGVRPALACSADSTNNSLVQWAAYYNHLSAVRYLTVVQGVSPDSPDESGSTALHRAAAGDRTAIVDALLRAGADFRAKDADGCTPLQLAPPHTRTAGLLRQWVSGVATVDCPRPKRYTLKRYILVVFFYVVLVLSLERYYSLVIRGHTSLPSPFSSLYTHIFFFFCVCVCFVTHLYTTFRNPGDITRGDVDQFVRYIEQAIRRGDSNVRLLSSAYCVFCFAERPLRSKHSRDRDVCVRRFDHECPWVNNSVGLYTHKALLLLVISTITAQVLFIHAMFLVASAERSNPRDYTFLVLLQHPTVCALIVIHIVIAIFCTVLCVTHARLIVRGMTTYEAIMAGHHEKPLKHQYDHGIWTNIMAFLTSTGPGTEIAQIPSPSSIFSFFPKSFGNLRIFSRKKVASIFHNRDSILPTNNRP